MRGKSVEDVPGRGHADAASMRPAHYAREVPPVFGAVDPSLGLQ